MFSLLIGIVLRGLLGSGTRVLFLLRYGFASITRILCARFSLLQNVLICGLVILPASSKLRKYWSVVFVNRRLEPGRFSCYFYLILAVLIWSVNCLEVLIDI